MTHKWTIQKTKYREGKDVGAFCIRKIQADKIGDNFYFTPKNKKIRVIHCLGLFETKAKAKAYKKWYAKQNNLENFNDGLESRDFYP